MRKSRYRRRDIGFEVKKHKIQANRLQHHKGILSLIFIGNLRKELVATATKCRSFIENVSYKLRLVPLSRDEYGKVVVAPLKNRVAHYGFLCMWIALASFKLHACKKLISEGPLGATTFVGVAMCAAVCVPLALSAACILKPTETAQLVNGCESILLCIGADVGRKVSTFDSTAVALEVLGAVFIAWVCALDATVLTLIYDSLPLSLYPTAKRLGLVGGAAVPDIVWQILFLPAEFVSYLLPILSTIFACQLYLTTIGAYRICINEIR